MRRILKIVFFTEPVNAGPRCNKRKRTTARQSAINMEVDARINKLNMLTKQELEIHDMRKEEAKLKIEVQKEMLKKARLETSTA